MSIGTFQEKFLTQKGCGTALALGTAFIMSFFIFQNCARYGGNGNDRSQNTPRASETVVKVGDQEVTSDQVTTSVNRALQNQPAPGFANAAAVNASTISSLLNQAAVLDLADQNHVPVNDATLLAAAKEVLDQQMEMGKQQLGIKPGASQAEIDATFKKLTHKTPAEIERTQLDSLKQALKDPARRTLIVKDLKGVIYQNQLRNSVKLSDQELKSNYDTYIVKRILVPKPTGIEAAKAKAEEALKAIRSGATFEAAMDKYSADPPPGAGKKKSDSTITVPEILMNASPSYNSFHGQKAGFISPVIDTPEGEVIYKVVTLRNDAPKDFEKNKEALRRQMLQTKVQQKLQEDTKRILDSSTVSWMSKGYQALYDFTKTYQISDPRLKETALDKVVQEAKAAMTSPGDKQPALYAWFNAESAQYQGTPGVKSAALRADRIAALKAVLESSEDYDLRMELFDLDLQQKDGEDALHNLVLASQNNSSFDLQGEQRFRDIAAKGEKLIAAKLITPDQVKEFQNAQTAWRKGKSDSDKMAAQVKEQEAAQKVKDAENEKANKALIEKQKAQSAKKTAGAPPLPKGP